VDAATRSTERLARAQKSVKQHFVVRAGGGGANQSVITRTAGAAAGGGAAPSMAGGGAGATMSAAAGAFSGASEVASGAIGAVGNALTSLTSMGQAAVGMVGGAVSMALGFIPVAGTALAAIGGVITGALQAVVGAIGSVVQGITSLVTKVVGFISSAAGAIAKFAGVIVATLAGAFASFAASSIAAAADMEALTMGLMAVSGSAAEASAQIERLALVAKIPGLGFREALQGSIALQAAGLSARLAEAALIGFGNALATVGKGKADLDGVMLALTQIAAKGKIMGQEINQIAERVPQIRQIMLAAFGTASGEQLEQLGIDAKMFIALVTQELLKLPMVTGGAKNAFENLGDTWDRLKMAAGSVFSAVVIPLLEKVAAWGEALVASGVIETIAAGFAGLFAGVDGPAITGFLTNVVAVISNIPSIIEGIGQTIRGVVQSVVTWVMGVIQKIGAWLTKFGESQRGKWREGSLLDRVGGGARDLGGLMTRFGANPEQTFGSSALGQGIAGVWDSVKQRVGESRAGIEQAMAGTKGSRSDPIADARAGLAQELAGTSVGQTGLLSDIAANTAATAKNTAPDLRRSTLGGNDLGRVISERELSGIRAGARSNGEVKIIAQDEDLARWMRKNFMQLFGELSAQGLRLSRT
jgi:tape measure domain-containing protein